MKTLVKTVDGFEIYFEALEELTALEDFLPDHTPGQIEEIRNTCEVFCAKVSTEKSGIELGYDYLGCCIYKTYEDFYTTKECYFDDMVNTVITEAKKSLPKIIEELKKLTP